MEESLSLRPLLIVAILALTVPFVLFRFKRIRIPVVVGEIIAGIIVGKSGLGLVKDDPWLSFLALLGFTYLMFLGGAEIDFSTMQASGRAGANGRKAGSPLVLPAAVLVLTLGLSMAASMWFVKTGLVYGGTHPLMLALIISTASVGVILPTLKETGVLGGPYGQAVLISATIIDIATVAIATVALVVLRPGAGAWQLAAFAGLCACFVLLFYAGAKFSSHPFVRRVYEELSNTSAQVRVRTAFVLMLLFAFLSQTINVEMILGAFLAGAMFSLFFRPESTENLEKFDAIGYGFLLPIFFIMTGARLDLSLIWRASGIGLLFCVLLGAAFAVKVIPALVFWPRFGLRNAAAGGLLLTGQLSLTIAFAQVAVSAKLLDPSFESVAVLLALSTCTLSPVLFFALWKAPRDDAPAMEVIVFGAGKVGRTLALHLREKHHNVMLLDHDPGSIAKARNSGLSVFDCPGVDEASFRRAGVQNADVFVAATNDDKANLDACLLAKNALGIQRLVARSGNPENAALFIENGVRPMNMTNAAVVSLESLVSQADDFKNTGGGWLDTAVVEVEVRNPDLAGRRISEMSIPGESSIVLVKRKGGIHIPFDGTMLEKGDVVTVRISSSVPAGQVEDFFRGTET